MPFYPKGNRKVTVTLSDGSDVNLIERRITVEQRRELNQRMMEAQFTAGRAQTLVSKAADANLNRDEWQATMRESVSLISDIDTFELYADVLAARFESWDYYATKDDFEASRAVPMTMADIVEQCEYVIVEEIITLIGEQERAKQKKEKPNSAISGNGSMTAATASRPLESEAAPTGSPTMIIS